MQNLRQFLWMIVFVIMVACLEVGQRGPSNNTKTPDLPANLQKVQRQEKLLVVSMFMGPSDGICSLVDIEKDGEKMESIKCHLKSGGTVTFSLVSDTSLTIETKEGEVIADDQTDGTVDFGLDPAGERKYFREFRLQHVEGEKNQRFWQNRLEEILDELESKIVHTSKRASNTKFEALFYYFQLRSRACRVNNCYSSKMIL